MVAQLLTYPMWHQRPFEMGEWPNPDEVDRSRYRLEMQLTQFNVRTSATEDQLGLSFETLALCGLCMISDHTFLELLRYRCLMCGKAFFCQWKFFSHLQQHNFRQLDTYLCYHRLQLRLNIDIDTACKFCEQRAHLLSLGYRCVPLYNLALFLCNGSPTSGINLEERAHCRPDGLPRDPVYGGTKTEESQGSQKSDQRQEIRAFLLRRAHGHGGPTGIEDGGHGPTTAAGTSVCDAFSTWPGEHHSGLVGGIGEVAPGGEDYISPTHPSLTDGPDAPGEGREDRQLQPTGHTVEGVPSSGSDQQPGQHAVPEMEPQQQEVEALEGCHNDDPGDGPYPPELAPLGPGSNDDPQVPCADKDHGGVGPGCAMAVASEQPQQHRSLAFGSTIVLSQYLASDQGANTATIDRQNSPVEEHPTNPEPKSVRILVNHNNCCYANACVLCLTWVTVLMGAIDPTYWPAGGFELFRNMTTDSWLPLNLTIFKPFLWLMGAGFGWSIGDLDIQQDAVEFCQWFLQRTKPTFIDSSWSAQHLRQLGPEDLRDGSEKGAQHGVIILPIFDPLLASCTLQHLIDVWHNPLGLCRGAMQVGSVLTIQISRYFALQPKCTQRIDFDVLVRFPVFRADD